ncbi:MAG: phosphoribosylglycinamide formyltransferase, partial [Nevskiales bacterium]|nr:phosphoribosylglycinamide formyltransferase [Nevskiales bacterium]
ATCVVSSRADAPGLERARQAGVPAIVVPHAAYADRAAFDAALAATLDRYRVDLIALAGFMRILGNDFIRRSRGRLVNIHPSLLPQYRGLNTHRRVLEAGEREHGASVHFVTEELDGGPMIIQGRLKLNPGDNEHGLMERVMHEVELKIYPQALAWLARGELRYTAGGVEFRGRPLTMPLSLRDLEPEFR